MASSAAFAEHQAWIASINAQYAAMSRHTEDHSSPSPVGGTAPSSPVLAGVQKQQMPWAATTWAEQPDFETRLQCAMDAQFGALALDPDEEPVYRNLSMDAFEDAQEVMVDDEPVYRSFSLGDVFASSSQPEPASPFPSLADPASVSTAAEAQWLQTMPPLLRRQNAQILW